MITKKFFLFVFLFAAAFAQAQITITGTIVDKEGAPVPAASILEKGTANGKMADFDGKFDMTVKDKNAVLVISNLGFKTQELTVGDQTTIKVTIEEEFKVLEEAVVVGYGVTKKSDLTGAVSTINNTEIKAMHVASVDMALQGKASGLEVSSNSGSPGGNVTIRIRGTGTINNADPIFVVDGLVMDPGAINFLNPEDIEDVVVLKDASATAIYGSRGANGVIMITTKKGKAGEPKVSLSSYFGWQTPSHWMDMANGKEYATIKNIRAGQNKLYDPDTVANTNWFDEISQIAPMTNYNMSISGGTEKATYLFSASYLKQEGIIKTTGFDRLTVRMNNDFKIRPWLKIGESFQLANSNRQSIDETNAYNGTVVAAMNYSPITPVNGESVLGEGGTPLQRLEKEIGLSNGKDFRVVGNAYADVIILKDLIFKSTLGLELDNSEYRKLIPPYMFTGTDTKELSTLENGWYKSFNWQWENYFTYKKTIKKLHNIVLMGGTSAFEYTHYNIWGRNENGPKVNDPSLQYFDMYDSKTGSLRGGADQASIFSLIGRLNYDFSDKYLATLTIRRDGSSKFGPNYRYGNFPSAALGWKVSKEKFMKNIKVISMLKLRAGWGKIGNEKIGTGQYLGYAASGIPYSFNNTAVDGATILRSPNKDIRWESTVQTNFGLDAGLFKNRLEFTAEYFKRTTTDMLAQIELPGISGIPRSQMPVGNIGSVLNNGVEFNIGYKNLEGEVKFKAAGNFSKIFNKVLELGQTTFIYSGSYGNDFKNFSYTAVDYPMGCFWGYKTEGIFDTYEEINAHAFQSQKTAPGDLKFKDLNSDGKIDENDQTIIGNPFPKFTYGWNCEVSYKGFDLSLAFQGVYGNDIYALWKVWAYPTWNDNKNYHSDLLDAWTPTNTESTIAHIDTMQDPNGNCKKLSDYFIEKGSYLRLKNAQLGYTLPKTVTAKLHIDQCRIYIGCQNLLTFTKYKGNDPEVGLVYGNSKDSYNNLVINVDYGTVPQPRIFTLGFNLTF